MKRLLFLALTLCLCSTSALALSTGDQAPNFSLKAQDGHEVALSDLSGKVVVLEWFNKGCPFVQKHYLGGNMQALQESYTKRGVTWLTINSTEPTHKDFLSPEAQKALIAEWKIKSTAMLTDSDGRVGKSYGAKTTPHMFVIGADGKLAYVGAIDDEPSPTADPAEAKNYVRAALDSLLSGAPVAEKETKPYGCSIKYAD